MSQSARVAGQLEDLHKHGAALVRRPRREIVSLLASLLETWRDPDSRWHTELAEALPDATGFSPACVREGLALGLAPWTGAALERLVALELPESPGTCITGFASTSLLLAGSIPMPTLLAMLGPLLLGSPLLVRAASRDRLTAPLVARSIAELDSELAQCVALTDFEHDDDAALDSFLAADCVVAYGSDDTVAKIARRLPPARRLVRHAHRLSLAVLGDAATRGATLVRAAEGLALDTALWDQQGCLSPIAVYVLSEDDEAADRVSEALASALASAQTRWPRGRVEPQAAARLAQERDGALLRESAGQRVRVLCCPRGTWTLVREADATARSAPRERFLRVHPVTDADRLAAALAPFGRHLAGVATAGIGARETEVLVRLGASRLCAPGTLQSPPLDWHHEGAPVLTPMARVSDLEIPPESPRRS